MYVCVCVCVYNISGKKIRKLCNVFVYDYSMPSCSPGILAKYVDREEY